MRIKLKFVFLNLFNLFNLFSLCLFSELSFAWNSMGHRVIGEIAYQHLTPTTKTHINQLINYLSDAYPYSSSFQTANAWADYLKQDAVHAFDSWHYIDTPFSPDNTPLIFPQETNLLWALNQALNIVKNPKTNQYEKALFIRFLLHFTEDAHQPLHCMGYFSKDFPQGDKGGNLIRISQGKYHNLHAYWDDGAGLLNETCGYNYSKKRKAVCLATQFQRQYPESFFKNAHENKIQDLNPEHWTNDSYQISKTFVYNFDTKSVLSDNYIKQAQEISKQQIALSAYRLASILNSIYQ